MPHYMGLFLGSLYCSIDLHVYYMIFSNLLLIGVELIYNVMLVSGVQQNDSHIHIFCIYLYIHTHIYFCRLFSIVGNLQDTEHSFLCYEWVFVVYLFYIVVCIC